MQLLNILGTKNNIKVIRTLVRHKDWEFNISEFSKDTKLNKGVLSRIVKKLEKENVIKVNRKGKILLFKINKDNLFIKNVIIPLFEKEQTFFKEHLKNKLINLKEENVLSIILYGSYASGEANLTSDIDIMVVIKNKTSSLINKSDNLKNELLKEDFLLRIDIINLSEFKKLYKLKEPLLKSIEKNHQIIHGKKIEELL